MATLANTGFFLRAKLKGTYEKDKIDKDGRPYKGKSLRVVFYPKGPDEEETRSTFISVPPGFALPKLDIGTVYTFAVDVSGGKDRSLFLNLNTHVAIEADE